MLTVILTGGGSRRMGRDKAMLPWEGATMAQSLIDKYSKAFGRVAVSVNRAGRFPVGGAMELVDRYPDMGPMNGIISGFLETEENILFLTATDLPFGDPALVEKLKMLMGSADACVMRRGVKGVEPLFALYSRACLEPAKTLMEDGKKSIQRLLELVNVRYVEEAELAAFDLAGILRNVNTQEEYNSLVRP